MSVGRFAHEIGQLGTYPLSASLSILSIRRPYQITPEFDHIFNFVDLSAQPPNGTQE